MIQCFVKTPVASGFAAGCVPRLLSASKIDSVHQAHPRVLHKHRDCAELLYVRSGSGVYIIDETRYPIKTGDVVICNPSRLHDEDPACSRELNTLAIAVTDVQIKDLPPNHLISPALTPVISAGEWAQTMENLMTMIHSLLASRPDEAAATCQHLAGAVLSQLQIVIEKYCPVEGNAVPSRAEIVSGQVKTYIDTHFDQPFTLQDIASAIGVSPYHLAHLFKDQTGYSPMQYALRRRLGEAQSLLISTNLTVGQISSAVGFGNPCHFNTMFSKYIGMPPNKYRSSYVEHDKSAATPQTRSTT